MKLIALLAAVLLTGCSYTIERECQLKCDVCEGLEFVCDRNQKAEQIEGA